MRPAPALLRWMRWATPGVSERTRSMSICMVGWSRAAKRKAIISSSGGSEPEIGMPDDAGAKLHCSIGPAGAHRRDAVDEFRLPHRLQRLRSGGAVHRVALHE